MVVLHKQPMLQSGTKTLSAAGRFLTAVCVVACVSVAFLAQAEGTMPEDDWSAVRDLVDPKDPLEGHFSTHGFDDMELLQDATKSSKKSAAENKKTKGTKKAKVSSAPSKKFDVDELDGESLGDDGEDAGDSGLDDLIQKDQDSLDKYGSDADGWCSKSSAKNQCQPCRTDKDCFTPWGGGTCDPDSPCDQDNRVPKKSMYVPHVGTWGRKQAMSNDQNGRTSTFSRQKAAKDCPLGECGDPILKVPKFKPVDNGAGTAEKQEEEVFSQKSERTEVFPRVSDKGREDDPDYDKAVDRLEWGKSLSEDESNKAPPSKHDDPTASKEERDSSTEARGTAQNHPILRSSFHKTFVKRRSKGKKTREVVELQRHPRHLF